MKVTPRHNKFIASIADSPIHIIATMRGKDQYEIEKGENDGKLNVRKLGVGAKQRDGFEYEFSVTFSLDQKSNMAISQKDNTHIFEREGELLLEEKHGRKIIEWANSGEGYTPPVRSNAPVETPEPTNSLKADVIAKCKELGGQKNKGVMALFKKHGNPNSIDDEKLQAFMSDLKELENKVEEKEEE